MKKLFLVLLMVVMASAMVLAQGPTQAAQPISTGAPGAVAPLIDVLGAHQNYGRGCAGCHAPHSGAFGEGGNAIAGKTVDQYTGVNALFGQDMGPLWGQTFDFSDISATGSANKYLLATAANGDPVGMTAQQYSDMRGAVMCLACHDGAVAKGAMMQNWAFEEQIKALPSTYGTAQDPDPVGRGRHDQRRKLDGRRKLQQRSPNRRERDAERGAGQLLRQRDEWHHLDGQRGRHHRYHLCRPVCRVCEFLRRAGPVEGRALLRNAGQRFEHSLRGLHDLPRPALDERVLGRRHRQPDRYPVHRNVREVLLHQCSVQPEHSERSARIRSLHDPVLPPVPLWRVERSQRRHAANGVLTSFLYRSSGEGMFPSPCFVLVHLALPEA